MVDANGEASKPEEGAPHAGKPPSGSAPEGDPPVPIPVPIPEEELFPPQPAPETENSQSSTGNPQAETGSPQAATDNSPVPPGPRWPYIVASVALVADQWSKGWFQNHYSYHESHTVIPGFFDFFLTHNTGAAFSLFHDQTLLLMLFSTLVFGLMLLFRHKLFGPSVIEQLAFGLIAGGVVGNLADRMKYGYVIDFIHWYVGKHSWPVFNLADTFICVGVGLFVLSGFQKKA